MSENTVKVHLRHMMKKLNVRNRTEIAIMRRRLDETGNTSRAAKLLHPRTDFHFDAKLEHSRREHHDV
jgi:regulatory LuxR family protein